MKSWLSNLGWAFRRTSSQQPNTDEEYSLPGTTSSLNADLSYSGSDHGSEHKCTNLDALIPTDPEEGIVFAKNNVFLRISNSSSSPKQKGHRRGDEHGNNSGYFYMRTREISFHGNTYVIHWLANSELTKVATGTELLGEPSTASTKPVSIELNSLEKIKIFYDSETGSIQDSTEYTLSNGQVILYSKDGVFHIFKFISGGLGKLTNLLRGCPFLRETNKEIDQENHKHVTFVVYAPKLGLKEMHPAEHEVQTELNKETWNDLHDREGRITALKLIQKVISLQQCKLLHAYKCNCKPIRY